MTGPAPNFQKKSSTVMLSKRSPDASVATATVVNKIAIGSFAALSISTVDESRAGSDCRRRIEKIAAASVDEIITDSSNESSIDQSSPSAARQTSPPRSATHPTSRGPPPAMRPPENPSASS